MKTRSFALAVALVALVGVPACGDDTSDSGDAATTTEAVTTTEATTPTISGAWARNSPMEATNGAAYMEVTGGSTDDTITGVSVDPSVAARVEMHETVEADAGSSMGTETTMGGTETTMGDATATTLAPAMEMRPIESIGVPAGRTVVLEPGGLHIMLLDLVKPLEIGDTFDLTVTFETAGEQKVQVEVKDAP